MIPESPAPMSAADHLKYHALRLFAEHGVDGVTVRQIATAGGQKNHAALTYHFGSKEALVRSLVAAGAREIDERRNKWLDKCELDGGPSSVVEVMAILVHTAVDLSPPLHGQCYNRFLLTLQLSDRALFLDALGGSWMSGYQRCLEHIRRLVPQLAVEQLNRRLVFLGRALSGILAGREVQLADLSRQHPMWSDSATLDDVAIGLAAFVVAPATAQPIVADVNT